MILWLQCDIVWRCLTAISVEVFPVTSGLKAILWCSETPRGGYRCQLGSPIDEGTRWLPFVLRRSILWNDWGQDNRAILASWMSWMCRIWFQIWLCGAAAFFGWIWLYAIGFAEERNEQINKGLKDGSLEKGVYRGLGGYKQLGIISIVLPYCFGTS